MATFILCIDHESGMAGKRLLKSIRDQFADIEKEHYHRIEDLQKRICRPAYGKDTEIVIVLIDNGECLERLIRLKGCLDGRRLVLVLQEMNRKILSRSHILRPRYVSCGENQFNDLLSVLEKMINAPAGCVPAGDDEGITVRKIAES